MEEGGGGGGMVVGGGCQDQDSGHTRFAVVLASRGRSTHVCTLALQKSLTTSSHTPSSRCIL